MSGVHLAQELPALDAQQGFIDADLWGMQAHIVLGCRPTVFLVLVANQAVLSWIPYSGIHQRLHSVRATATQPEVQHDTAAAAKRCTSSKGSSLSQDDKASREGCHMSDSVSLTKTNTPGLKPTLSTYLAPATLDSPVVMLYERSPQPACTPCLRQAALGVTVLRYQGH